MNMRDMISAAVGMAIEYNKTNKKFLYAGIMRRRAEDWAILMPLSGDTEMLAALILAGEPTEITTEEAEAIREDYFPDPYRNYIFEEDIIDDPAAFEMEMAWMGVC